MPELSYPSVFILAPPFLSHFRPLLALGTALKRTGAMVTIGCSEDFRAETEASDLFFREVTINRNANRGVAVETDQADDEARRLHEFLEATKRGPVETLITQGRHRVADMFANPEELIDTIRQIDAEQSPSLWIVDQLSYGATLAVYGLRLPFVTFCAPHPLSIPRDDMVYSVPPVWPDAVAPSDTDAQRLLTLAKDVEKSFTASFNSLLQSSFAMPGVQSAFALASPLAVVCNYPPFPAITRQGQIFGGHSFASQELPPAWKPRVAGERFRVLVALGTFLSSREDVLASVVEHVLAERPDAQVLVGAGAHAEELDRRFDDRVIAESFLPQRALLPHIDLVCHHGGVSSFTESLFLARPMVVMPFSSDQFNVARDVERERIGAVLDPNKLSQRAVASAMQEARDRDVHGSLLQWSEELRRRGPDFVARSIQDLGGSREHE